jgi:hypothetical protein
MNANLPEKGVSCLECDFCRIMKETHFDPTYWKYICLDASTMGHNYLGEKIFLHTVNCVLQNTRGDCPKFLAKTWEGDQPPYRHWKGHDVPQFFFWKRKKAIVTNCLKRMISIFVNKNNVEETK